MQKKNEKYRVKSEERSPSQDEDSLIFDLSLKGRRSSETTLATKSSGNNDDDEKKSGLTKHKPSENVPGKTKKTNKDVLSSKPSAEEKVRLEGDVLNEEEFLNELKKKKKKKKTTEETPTEETTGTTHEIERCDGGIVSWQEEKIKETHYDG